MNDESLNSVLDEEHGRGVSRCPKLGDCRAVLIDGEPDGNKSEIYFYPEDKVCKRNIPLVNASKHDQKLPGRSRLRNALFWTLLIGIAAMLVGVIVISGWIGGS
ncbi:hypothetical protein [Novipirellula rosea]|uniref:Uncharacterized protein n=1 Tax=Novipirellula rosea TaxID=1031540 RepID=A0ABP8MCV1_9BACT